MSNRVLVSGASGFIASHAIEQLLAAGDSVVGTVRNPDDKAKVGHLTSMQGAERLTLVAADLTDADPFGAHVDVDVIMHMASPYVLNVADPQRDLVDPAVRGTVSMLEAAARSPRVKRVVLTSSMAAITDEPDGRVLTEADWNTESSLDRNPYYFSKTLAERAAWDFVNRVKPGFDLVVINPFLVVGPSHTPVINASNQVMVDIVKRTYPAIMALNWGFVDVRDVAAAHLAAMNTPTASGRYICAAETISMAKLVSIISDHGYDRLPSLKLDGSFGTALMTLASYAQPKGVGSYLRTHLGRMPRFDNSKIRKELGITFRNSTQSIHDALDDLQRWGHIRKPDRR